MKDIKIDKDTCIDFAEYVCIHWTDPSIPMEDLWEEYQEKIGKEVKDILTSAQEKINHEILMLIAKNNAVQDEKWKKNEEALMMVSKILKIVDEKIDCNSSGIKITDNIVSANAIALHNIEKDLYVDDKFVLSEAEDEETKCPHSLKDFRELKDGDYACLICLPKEDFLEKNVSNTKQNTKKCDLHDTLPEAKQMDVWEALCILTEESTLPSAGRDEKWNTAYETCVAWTKGLLDKKIQREAK
tara:strand:- start:4466 stop:5194 length:729 start_codon:yes stop_codon:yes gene_type:complete